MTGIPRRPLLLTIGAVVALVAVTTGCASRGHPSATTADKATPSPAGSLGPISILGMQDVHQYGIEVLMHYRAGSSEHVLTATLRAAGVVGPAEMYKDDTDTSGLSQQPTLSAGQGTSVAAHAFPTCGTQGLGSHPTLTVESEVAGGGRATRTYPLDSLTSRLEKLAQGWCARGVMIGVSSAQGWPGCDSQQVTLIVRNPATTPATLTIDGDVYRGPRISVPAGGSAQWTVHSAGNCPAGPHPTATVRFGDGRVTHVSLFESPL